MLRSKSVKTINLYFTPFAVLLILSAAYLSYPGKERVIAATLLVILTTLLNFITARLVQKLPKASKAIVNTRLIVNFLINIVLVDMLIEFWGPMWLLFVLTPVASAVYETKGKMILMTSLSCIALMGIYIHKGLSGVVFWGQGLNHVLFIAVLAFFIKSLGEEGELCDVNKG
jgi:hypothetical protein